MNAAEPAAREAATLAAMLGLYRLQSHFQLAARIQSRVLPDDRLVPKVHGARRRICSSRSSVISSSAAESGDIPCHRRALERHSRKAAQRPRVAYRYCCSCWVRHCLRWRGSPRQSSCPASHRYRSSSPLIRLVAQGPMLPSLEASARTHHQPTGPKHMRMQKASSSLGLKRSLNRLFCQRFLFRSCRFAIPLRP
jgi:hypothetical protein